MSEQTTTISAPTIRCQGCANAVKQALQQLDSQAKVEIDVKTKIVTVRHSENTSREMITETLAQAGFPAA